MAQTPCCPNPLVPGLRLFGASKVIRVAKVKHVGETRLYCKGWGRAIAGLRLLGPSKVNRVAKVKRICVAKDGGGPDEREKEWAR